MQAIKRLKEWHYRLQATDATEKADKNESIEIFFPDSLFLQKHQKVTKYSNLSKQHTEILPVKFSKVCSRVLAHPEQIPMHWIAENDVVSGTMAAACALLGSTVMY